MIKPDWESGCGNYKLWNADCLDVIESFKTSTHFGAIITDPPHDQKMPFYEAEFPTMWYERVRRNVRTSYILVSVPTLPECLRMVNTDYQDTIAFCLVGGNTYSSIGRGGWVACVVSQVNQLYCGGRNVGDVYPFQERRYHPHEVPVDIVSQLLLHDKENNRFVFDPFAGSGTTGVACVKMGGCQFWGVEKDKSHFDTAVRRISMALKQEK